MKICTIVGNRPQFIKVAPVSLQLENAGVKEILVHTGQHYDSNLSDIFFKDLNLPDPSYHLSITAKSHGAMTGEILTKVEEILLQENPDAVLVYGDTNSTMAGALAAVKLRIPTAHVEAGVRINDVFSPEEANRVLVSHIAQMHFCCTQCNVDNLRSEGITQNVYWTGDVMLDAFLHFSEIAKIHSAFLKQRKLSKNSYVFATFHRPENVDSFEGCNHIFNLLTRDLSESTVVFPMHPRTRNAFLKHQLLEKLENSGNVILTDPISYLDTLSLLDSCKFVITDSGGLQREAFFAKKYCYFFFHKSCWPEIEDLGWQTRCNLKNYSGLFCQKYSEKVNNPFGDGFAASKIVDLLKSLAH